MEKCALYLIRDGRTGATKIGISNDPERRLGQISNSYYVSGAQIIKTTWFTSRNEAQRWETNFHRKYAAKRSEVQGGREWFDLSNVELQSFIEWMEASTNKRSLQVLRLEATVKKKPDQLRDDRMARAFTAAFGGSIFFIGTLLSGNFGIFLLLAIAVLLIGYSAPTETCKDAIYLLSGERVNESVIPVAEYKAMNLWDERVHRLNGVRSNIWNFPASITKEQASEFYNRGKIYTQEGAGQRSNC